MVGDSGAVPKELRGIATKLFDGEEVLKLPKYLLALINEDLLMSTDNLKAFVEPFDFFFGVLQRVLDIKDLIVDLIHAVGESAYVRVKVEIGVAIFTFCFVVKLL